MIGDDPITTVWRLGTVELTKVAVYRGVPFGDLALGDAVEVPGHGRAKCTGRILEGPLFAGDKTTTLIELRLTLL